MRMVNDVANDLTWSMSDAITGGPALNCGRAAASTRVVRQYDSRRANERGVRRGGLQPPLPK